MKLLPKELAQKIPNLYSQEYKGEEALVYIKLFDPCSNWAWFATEFDGEDTFFGLVIGHFTELGYFSLKELESFRNRLGLGIERDLHFTPMTLKEVREVNGC
ncbi:MAG: DUF2958 domain-containing protein [Candidatus Omnitrophota bacterium]